MKKIILVITVFSTVISFGQKIQEEEMELNAGLGFSSGWGVPVYAGLDYGVTEDISVGAVLSYATSSDSYGYYSVKGTLFSIGVNGNYHFNNVFEIPNKYDVYAGLTLAYNHISYDYSGHPDDGSRLGLAGQIGARYFFTDNLGLCLEFGGGTITSGGKIGITYKL